MQLLHKRFRMMDELSSLSCHRYAMEQGSIVPKSNDYNNIQIRPDCIYK
jgi:hypothetical protein